jgi:hypothetical protein
MKNLKVDKDLKMIKEGKKDTYSLRAYGSSGIGTHTPGSGASRGLGGSS